MAMSKKTRPRISFLMGLLWVFDLFEFLDLLAKK
jgi:hypothetical protein